MLHVFFIRKRDLAQRLHKNQFVRHCIFVNIKEIKDAKRGKCSVSMSKWSYFFVVWNNSKNGTIHNGTLQSLQKYLVCLRNLFSLQSTQRFIAFLFHRRYFFRETSRFNAKGELFLRSLCFAMKIFSWCKILL